MDIYLSPFEHLKRIHKNDSFIIHANSDSDPSGWGEPFTVLPGIPAITNNRIDIGFDGDLVSISRGVTDDVLAGESSWKSPDDLIYSWRGSIGGDTAINPRLIVIADTPTDPVYQHIITELGYLAVLTNIPGNGVSRVYTFTKATTDIYQNGVVYATAPLKILGFGIFNNVELYVCHSSATQDIVFRRDAGVFTVVGNIDYPNAVDHLSLPRVIKYAFSSDGSECSVVLDNWNIAGGRNIPSVVTTTFAYDINTSNISITNTDLGAVEEAIYTKDVVRAGYTETSTYYPKDDTKSVVGVGYRDNTKTIAYMKASPVSFGGSSSSRNVNVTSPSGFIEYTEDITFNRDIDIHYKLFFNDVDSGHTLSRIFSISSESSAWSAGFDEFGESTESDYYNKTSTSSHMSRDNTFEILYLDVLSGTCTRTETESHLVNNNSFSEHSDQNIPANIRAGTRESYYHHNKYFYVSTAINATKELISKRIIYDTSGSYSEQISYSIPGYTGPFSSTTSNDTIVFTISRQQYIPVFLTPLFDIGAGQSDDYGNFVTSSYIEGGSGPVGTNNSNVVIEKAYRSEISGVGSPENFLGLTGTNQSLHIGRDGSLVDQNFKGILFKD